MNWIPIAKRILDGDEDPHSHLYDPYHPIRVACARSPRLTDADMRTLSQDPNGNVRASIAARERLPDDILVTLSWDASVSVQASIAARDQLPADIRERYEDSCNARIQRALGNTWAADYLDTMGG